VTFWALIDTMRHDRLARSARRRRLDGCRGTLLLAAASPVSAQV